MSPIEDCSRRAILILSSGHSLQAGAEDGTAALLFHNSNPAVMACSISKDLGVIWLFGHALLLASE